MSSVDSGVQIVLYDIPTQLPASPVCSYSPHTLRIRYVLGYKGLKFRTEWVEYPDIESKAKAIGAEPTATRNGKPFYTCPIIKDLQHDKVISDSIRIAEYLDETYPNTPTVVPNGTHALLLAFADGVFNNLAVPAMPFLAPGTLAILNPASVPYWRMTRERWYGRKIEEMTPSEEKRSQVWAKVLEGLDKIAKWYKNPDDLYVMGDRISFADFQMASSMTFAKKIFGEDSAEWKEICECQGGKWKKLLDTLVQYEC